MSGKKIITLVLGLLLAVTAQADAPVVSNGVAKLNDAPAIQFETSGWDYANTTNPFFMTPDALTNALVGVSRLKPGQPFLKDGPTIPAHLTPSTIRAVLAKRLKGRSGLKLKTEKIGGREVIVATYRIDGKWSKEYAFALRGYLVHVLLLAKDRAYYDKGEPVERKVVETLKPLPVKAASADYRHLIHNWKKIPEKDGGFQLVSTYPAPVPFSMNGQPEATLGMDAGTLPPQVTLADIVKGEVADIRKQIQIADYDEKDGKKPVDGIATWYETINGTRVAFIKYRAGGTVGGPSVTPFTMIHSILINGKTVFFTHLLVRFADHQDEVRHDQRVLIHAQVRAHPDSSS